MKRIDRSSTEVLGCELQAVVVPATSWRWVSPCPFAQADVSAVCAKCSHLKTVSTSGGVGEPYVHIDGPAVP
jgi:hypothetical protein